MLRGRGDVTDFGRERKSHSQSHSAGQACQDKCLPEAAAPPAADGSLLCSDWVPEHGCSRWVLPLCAPAACSMLCQNCLALRDCKHKNVPSVQEHPSMPHRLINDLFLETECCHFPEVKLDCGGTCCVKITPGKPGLRAHWPYQPEERVQLLHLDPTKRWVLNTATVQ